MQPQATLQNFQFKNFHVQVYVPDEFALQQWYLTEQKENLVIPSPYWAQVWPAARALCHFIAEQPHWVRHKRVLELAAGLGLPSLLAAQFAKEVICSDFIPDAVEMIQTSIEHSGMQNIQSLVLNWNALPPDLKTDILLLSDINYEPAAFEILYKMMERFLSAGTTIILTTPQRLMAKPFIERLVPFCILQKEIAVKEIEPEVICTVMVLKK